MGGCAGPNEVKPARAQMGPDYDIGNSPILVTLANGKRALFAGTKGADILALDPDANGKVLFRVNPSGQPVGFTGRGRGGIVWGGASDQRQIYYGMGAAGSARSSRLTARRRGCSRLRASAAAAPRRLARRRRRSPVSSSRGPATAGSSRCPPRTESNCGSSTRRKISPPRTRCLLAAARLRQSGAVIVDGMVYIASGYAITAARRLATSCSRLVSSKSTPN